MSSLHHNLPISGEGRCELCERQQALTIHHLIPRSRHKKARTQRNFDRNEMKSRTALLCVPCHKQVHRLISERDLADIYNTLDSLGSHPEIARFVQWLRKRGDHFVP